jgi:hypothetical protein
MKDDGEDRSEAARKLVEPDPSWRSMIRMLELHGEWWLET